MCTPLLHVYLQLEQEFDLMLKKSDMHRSFSTDWKRVWVPAILKYYRILKKDVLAVVKELDEIQHPGQQVSCVCAHVCIRLCSSLVVCKCFRDACN